MVIETRGAGLRTDLDKALRFKRAPDQQCHYRGFVRGHDTSRAAISLCDGVVGYVQTDHGRYFIEPAIETEPKEDGQHVHIAYKRGPTMKDEVPKKKHCGTSDKWEEEWAKQLARREKEIMEEGDRKKRKETKETTPPFGHSVHRYMEIAVVADRKFLDFYNSSNFEQYLLTIMNIAADYYHDKSVGNQIDLVIVRMIYLEKEKEEIRHLLGQLDELRPAGPRLSRDRLRQEEGGRHLRGHRAESWDHSCPRSWPRVLSMHVSLLHLTPFASNLWMGCSHDTMEISGCEPQDKDESYFIMSPYVNPFTLRWSPCSRRFITNLIEGKLGDCLIDDPKNPPDKFKLPDMLAGAMYGADFQCDMQYPGSKMCTSHATKMCEQLWCQVNETTCMSNGAQSADGTKCGEKKWCIHKLCVDMGARPAAVHGGWGKWGPMSSCSRTCGGGLKYAERECDNPQPANKGKYCIGERKKLTICNTNPCDPKRPSYRMTQCASYNDKMPLSDNKLHNWTAHMSKNLDPCILYCLNEENSFVILQKMVNDSTPCKAGTNNMCVAGLCRKVGCDWVFDSDAIEDKCGVCKGDGTKCRPVEGVYNETKITSQIMKIVTIPKGARSISVKELGPHPNYLAVKVSNTNNYCLNKDFVIERAGDYECANSILMYIRPDKNLEEIFIKGPISEDLEFQYLMLQGKILGVHYLYYVMTTDTTYKPKYLWDFTEWSECSVRCAGGTMISQPTCIEQYGGKVVSSFCNGIPRPEPKTRVCNTHVCPAKWRVSQWSKCSACDGKKGTRHRKVQCVRPAPIAGQDDIQANLDACKGRVPKQKEECVGKRPCKKLCAKKPRDTELAEKEKETMLPAEEQGRLIDKAVDLSLARYLERAYGVPREISELESGIGIADFRQLLREWSLAEEGKRKRATSCVNDFPTPKPGAIIKDSLPVEKVMVMQAPLIVEDLQANLSDLAYQQIGDMSIGGGLDTSRIKVYNGTEAFKVMEEMEGITRPPDFKPWKNSTLNS
ncbi:A disintegrin and metalloproteinase with thrombospondin motifs 12-like isoform X2 [Apis cerana]|uniref:A disintegrin and metalloproteinase with thrombospondin motifs 12-like isoform X2 n=1 Tax=Apis cerana TaxID=7461 RepID=UPI002B224EC3|nr:A disintegrin and metalloproteinase with thrombospondin motifs 12-like isoform X2 [Apis cerana]